MYFLTFSGVRICVFICNFLYVQYLLSIFPTQQQRSEYHFFLGIHHLRLCQWQLAEIALRKANTMYDEVLLKGCPHVQVSNQIRAEEEAKRKRARSRSPSPSSTIPTPRAVQTATVRPGTIVPNISNVQQQQQQNVKDKNKDVEMEDADFPLTQPLSPSSRASTPKLSDSEKDKEKKEEKESKSDSSADATNKPREISKFARHKAAHIK